jgi:hypothetical protein
VYIKKLSTLSGGNWQLYDIGLFIQNSRNVIENSVAMMLYAYKAINQTMIPSIFPTI